MTHDASIERSPVRAGPRSASALTVGSGPNRLLRVALASLALIVCLFELRDLLIAYPWGVDVAIPLNAATRWMAGGQPYLASSFLAGSGPDAPYLYPPFVLLIVAPFTALPQVAVSAAWFVLSVSAAVFACRRLAIPWLVVPLVLLWPPFAEGLLGGNVQVMIFAAFVALMWRKPRETEQRRDFEPLERDLPDRDDARRGDLRDGLLATAIGAVKATQAQPWLYLLRCNWRAAAIGAGAVLALALVTLPFLGVQLWFDWLAQLSRANDPNWVLAGHGIAASLPWWVGDLIELGSLALVFVVPRRHAGAWVGLLALIGTPGLRTFGLLFALPAMLLVRREIALIAGLLMASYTFEGWWLGIGLVTGSLLLARWFPWLLEPAAIGRGAPADESRPGLGTVPATA